MEGSMGGFLVLLLITLTSLITPLVAQGNFHSHFHHLHFTIPCGDGWSRKIRKVTRVPVILLQIFKHHIVEILYHKGKTYFTFSPQSISAILRQMVWATTALAAFVSHQIRIQSHIWPGQIIWRNWSLKSPQVKRVLDVMPRQNVSVGWEINHKFMFSQWNEISLRSTFSDMTWLFRCNRFAATLEELLQLQKSFKIKYHLHHGIPGLLLWTLFAATWICRDICRIKENLRR